MAAADRIALLLHGGLGNQLFQYAAALDLVRNHDPGRVLVMSYGNEWGEGHPDLASLAGIPIYYPHRGHRTAFPGVAVRESWKDAVSTAVARVRGTLTGTRLVRQANPFADREVPDARQVVLDGFFQNRDWWTNSWRQVARIINAKRPVGVDDLRREARTAIKIRRSDYLGRGITLTEDYYRRALRVLGVESCEVTVITEDRDYLARASEILAERGCTARTPEPLTGNPNLDDFWHLAAAQRQVLANSSYCWWAAAVADEAMTRVETQVAYPAPWLPNAWSGGPLPDMGIDNWIPVSSEFE